MTKIKWFQLRLFRTIRHQICSIDMIDIETFTNIPIAQPRWPVNHWKIYTRIFYKIYCWWIRIFQSICVRKNLCIPKRIKKRNFQKQSKVTN